MKHNTHEILSHFGDLSLKMYLVGGFLRDMLIGKESKDVDLTTPHSPEEVQKVLKDHKPAWFHGIYSTNERHRTVVVLYFNGFSTIKLEITQFRIDLESEGHKANTKAASTLEEDLARRDFTINAIAGDTKKLYDPFGGEADCKARVLRCVTRPTGETGVNDDGSLYDIMERPMVRFKEDTLRVLRLFRFEARLKFKIDPDTLSDALECGVGDDISIERIRDEITATFEVPDADVSRFLERLKQLGVLKRCLPALYESADFCDSLEQSPVYHKEGDVWTHIKKVVHEAKPDAENRWIALLHDIAKPRTAYPKVNKDTGKLEPFASYHKHDKMGESMIRNEVGPHLKLNGTADGKYGDLIDKAALCCRYHLKIYQWSTNVGQPKKDANGNEIKDKDGNTVLIKVKPSHIVTVQAEMGKYLHLLKNLAEADHMGRPVQKGVEQFFKPVEKKDIDHHKIPLLNGKKLMKVFKLEPGPIVGLYHDKAMELQRSNPGITEEELLSMVRKQEGEINNENK